VAGRELMKMVFGGLGEGDAVLDAAHSADWAGDIARASPVADGLARAGGVAASDVDSEPSEDAVGEDRTVASATPLRRTSLSTKRILCSMSCSVI